MVPGLPEAVVFNGRFMKICSMWPFACTTSFIATVAQGAGSDTSTA